MFPVFAILQMILRSVSRCHYRLVKRPWDVCQWFANQKVKTAEFPDGSNGVRHSVYPGFKDHCVPLSFFLATIFGRVVLRHTIRRLEFRLFQSQIVPRNFAANSPCLLLESIRHIPTGAKRGSVETCLSIGNLFFKSNFQNMVCMTSFVFSPHPTVTPLPDRVNRQPGCDKMT